MQRNRTGLTSVSGDQVQEEESEALPKPDGPLVKVTLHDGQQLYAVVKGRRGQADGSWWFDPRIHLPAPSTTWGTLRDEPAPVDFRAPAGRCQPIDGEAYDQVPTERVGVVPAWKIEERAYFTDDTDPARVVHRGHCHANRDQARPATTEQARAVLDRADAAACQVCRPDRPLHLLLEQLGCLHARRDVRPVRVGRCSLPATPRAREGFRLPLVDQVGADRGVLHARCRDQHGEQQSKGVGGGVALAPHDHLTVSVPPAGFTAAQVSATTSSSLAGLTGGHGAQPCGGVTATSRHHG